MPAGGNFKKQLRLWRGGSPTVGQSFRAAWTTGELGFLV